MELCENQDVVSVKQMKNYNGIDLVKFICAFLVIIIHIPMFYAPFGEELSGLGKILNYALQHYICRLAVPFFFVCSGFFLYSKMSTDHLDLGRIKNYCFKLFGMIGIWSVLLFVGGTFHLWYLGATVVAVTLVSLGFHFRIKSGWLFLIVCLLYAVGLLGESYFGLVEPLTRKPILKYVYAAWNVFVGQSRNGIFMGSIFVLIGVFFSQNKINLKLGYAIVGFVLSMIGLFGEVFVLLYYDIPKDYNMYILLVPAVFFLFSIAYTIELKDRPIYRKLRIIGVLVYFLHILMNVFVHYGIAALYKILNIDIKPYRGVLVLVSTFFVAVCIERLSRTERFKWLNWFLK